MEQKQIYGILGSIFLLISLLLPFVYISNGFNSVEKTFLDLTQDSYIILFITIISFVLSFNKSYNILKITSVISLIILLSIIIQLSHSKLNLLGYTNKSIGDTEITHFLWGWNFFLAGTILLIFSAFSRKKKV